MAELVIKGDKKYLEMIKKENRLRASKYSLEFELKEGTPKQEKAKKPRKKKEY